jgi:hypothetical protein
MDLGYIILTQDLSSGLCALYANNKLKRDFTWSEYVVCDKELTVIVPNEGGYDHSTVCGIAESKYLASDLGDFDSAEVFYIKNIPFIWLGREDADHILTYIEHIIGSDLVTHKEEVE